MQRGTIYKKHGAWFVVYRALESVNGQWVRKQKTHRLASTDEYKTKTSVTGLADEHLRSQNLGSATPESSTTVSDFASKFFLPYVKANKKPSTLKFYKDMVDNHIEPLIGNLKLREVSTPDIQRLLNARSSLSHTSVIRLKNGCSTLLSYAIREGFLKGANAAREAKAEGKRSDFEGYAYSFDEVLWMLERLPEPSRTVVAVAAFSGLREAEIRGLRWTDYDGQFFNVRTSIWRTHEGQTKTRKSKNSVPIIEPLRKILAAHKQSNGKSEWIFAGEKKGRPLHLDNLCRREIKPIVGDRWHGWHAFRRGLATVLYSIGERAETAQTILRHEDVSTTQEHYLMLKSKAEGNAAMKRLSKVLEKKMAQKRVRQSVRQARMQNAK